MGNSRQRDAVMTFEEERERLEEALSDAHDALGRAEGLARKADPALADELVLLRNRLLGLCVCAGGGEPVGSLVCRYCY